MMLERVKIHTDDIRLAADETVLGFLKIVGMSDDNRAVHIEVDRYQRRRLIQNGIHYAYSEAKLCTL